MVAAKSISFYGLNAALSSCKNPSLLAWPKQTDPISALHERKKKKKKSKPHTNAKRKRRWEEGAKHQIAQSLPAEAKIQHLQGDHISMRLGLNGNMEVWLTNLALTMSPSLCFEHVSNRKRWANIRSKWRAINVQMLVLVVKQVIHHLTGLKIHIFSLHFHILALEHRLKSSFLVYSVLNVLQYC